MTSRVNDITYTGSNVGDEVQRDTSNYVTERRGNGSVRIVTRKRAAIFSQCGYNLQMQLISWSLIPYNRHMFICVEETI